MTAPEAWSKEEVELAVADYVHMLTLELSGQTYNKSTHRRVLQQKLFGRTEGSIERKHQNISAVMIELGCPYISGYKPLNNYQAILFDVVANYLGQDQLFDRSAMSAVERPAAIIPNPDLKLVLEAPPLVSKATESEIPLYRTQRTGVKRDYLDREARNRSLGDAGEAFALAFERQRLMTLGKPRLCDKVEHVSKTRGDGFGFDILSFEPDGKERFIEVKTTAFGKETPFFISRNEMEFSVAFAEQFHLYRLFEFRKLPRMFDLAGKVQDRVMLDPVSYLARFA